MNKNNCFMTIQDIINQLEELGAKLEAGRLGSEEVIEMADLSRDLYERLVVIRHKSYEDLIREERDAEVVEEPAAGPLDETLEPETPPVSSEKEVITEAISEKEPEPNSDRDVEVTGPVIPMGSAEISPNQISLIDSIEEIKRMEQSLNDKFQEKSEEKSLAQRLKQKPIEDLTSSIGINMKFRFITQLFNEDKAAFEVSVQKLNSFGSYIEADEYIQNTLSEQYGWNPKDPVVKELIDLAQRRYL
ncbi:MAG TPA: hypothetical protein VJ894_03470 [Cryomorphaceae bacterium]|nr:hypothetical protein [Cryomorphaceae bacterium]